MKKLFTLFLLGCAAATANAQYQVQNGGFEEWETPANTYENKKGEEPVHWSSFLTGTGSETFKQFAANNQVEKSTETRPGSIGKSSAKIIDFDVKLGGIVHVAYAQGNLTTGCINMGSMTANDPGKSAAENIANRETEATGNYNYTESANEDFNQKFTGLPDAMHVWVKFTGGTEKSPYAKASTLLHTKGYYQDPLPKTNDCSGKLVAAATTLEIASSDKWQELTIPFEYSITDGTRPAYALVSFSTNATPGEGTGSDVMLIDDLEYLYYSELATLTYDGENIFKEGTTNYDLSQKVYNASKLACTSNGKGATIEKAYNEETGVLTITVKGDNWSEDNTNQHVYTIQFNNTSKDYTNDLLVVLGGNPLGAPQEDITIQLAGSENGNYSFILKDFSVNMMGRPIPVGTIQLDSLSIENGKITTSQTIQIQAGSNPGAIGPGLGNVPVELEATVNDDEIRATIAIDMMGGINVTFAPAITVNSTTNIADDLSGWYNVTINRSFPAGWSTICLPFETTVAALGATQAQAFTAFADNVLTFDKVDNGNLAANTPYLIYFEEAKDLSAAPIYMPVEIESSTPGVENHGDVTFTGNYTAGMSMVGLYGVGEQNGAQYIMKGGAGSTLGSTGAYFTVSGTTAGVNTLSLDIEGEGTTGIESIVAEEGETFDVYTLTGVKVRTAATGLDGLQRGIYIVNGKKVLVK